MVADVALQLDDMGSLIAVARLLPSPTIRKSASPSRERRIRLHRKRATVPMASLLISPTGIRRSHGPTGAQAAALARSGYERSAKLARCSAAEPVTLRNDVRLLQPASSGSTR